MFERSDETHVSTAGNSVAGRIARIVNIAILALRVLSGTARHRRSRDRDRMSSTQDIARRPGGSAGPARDLRRGEKVRVRSADDILATLDEHGDTARLPFMPEMLSLCGRTFDVQARADKTCDTLNMVGCTRAMSDTVHLVGARCDGSAHGGCQAGCLLFFKEEWLERADVPAPGSDAVSEPAMAALLDSNVMSGPATYRCQATRLLEASRPLDDTSDRHWLDDLRTRNVPLPTLVQAFALAVINKYQRFSQKLPGRLRIAGGGTLPTLGGTGTQTPKDRLDLQPGEMVEVKSKDEIMATLDAKQRNRGLSFDVEMLRYCGRKARVLRRVERIIDEKSGRMLHLNSDCIMLEDVVCVGTMHKLCPRSIYSYWREVWLRRVEEPSPGSTGT